MKRKSIITGIVMAASAAMATAQESQRSNAHIGFIYPLSTNGVKAPEYTNRFSIHAIAGVSKSEEAFCASGVANVVLDRASGFVGAGVANIVLGGMEGFQGAGTVNYAGGSVQGMQAAGTLNYAGSVQGMQAAGFGNIALHSMQGVQAAGFINVADTVDVQLAGYINKASNTRLQASGFINIAKEVNGSQIAGFINIARKVKGVQVSGFINIADSSDCPIGLINIIAHGDMAIGVTMNETGTTLATFRSGGRMLYGIIGVGGNYSEDYRAFAMQAGLGMHIPLSRNFRLNAEASVTSLSDWWYHTDIRSGFKLMPAMRFGNFEVFAGPSFSYTASSDRQGLGRVGYSVWNYDSRYYSQDLSIGFEGGIQYHLDSRKAFRKNKVEKKSVTE